MDYEKVYKEALERARKSHDKANGFIKKEWIENIFPELKESEDERIRKSLIDFVEQYGDNYYGQIAKASAIAWLEKQGEQNFAWSDEDYNMIHCCTSAIWAADYYSNEDKEKMENWLKSLKPQPQWKPTEEQLHCFKCVIDFYKTKVDDTIVQSLLDSLYNDLKKL